MIRLRATRVLSCTVLVLAAGVARSESRPWGGGTQIAWVGDEVAGGVYDPSGSSAMMPMFAVQRPVNRTLWLRGELGYKPGYGSDFRSHLVPLGVGFRWADTATNGIGAYLELYPSIFGYRVEARTQLYETGSQHVELSTVVPGLMTGFGLFFQASPSLSMTYGIRIQRSAEIREDVGHLQNVGFQVGIDWRPPFEP